MSRVLSCFYYWKCKTDLLLVTYTVLTNISTYFEAAISTRGYSSTYPKVTLANYVS